MSTRHVFALIAVFCITSQVGCVCMSQFGCGRGCGCGMGGQVYQGDCCPSCGVADCSCGCPEASCCCPDASCGCPDTCGCGVGCGAPVRGRCRLLARLRDCICGCSGCGCQPYWNDWQGSPPCDCDPCDAYGNYIGGPYGSPHGRRAQLAKKNMNLGDELRFGEEDVQTIYR